MVRADLGMILVHGVRLETLLQRRSSKLWTKALHLKRRRWLRVEQPRPRPRKCLVGNNLALAEAVRLLL